MANLRWRKNDLSSLSPAQLTLSLTLAKVGDLKFLRGNGLISIYLLLKMPCKILRM